MEKVEKKETLLQIILGTIGGLIFAVGKCMCLIPEWNLFTVGVVGALIMGFGMSIGIIIIVLGLYMIVGINKIRKIG